MGSSLASSSHQFLLAKPPHPPSCLSAHLRCVPSGRRSGGKVIPKWRCYVSLIFKSQVSMKNEMKPSTFSSTITTDMPLHESSGVLLPLLPLTTHLCLIFYLYVAFQLLLFPSFCCSRLLFDQYLANRSRVFQAIFPDKRRSKRLNEDEWRIHMLPINFLFLTVWPVVEMRLRCKSQGKDYPVGVPLDVTRVLELDIVLKRLVENMKVKVNGSLLHDFAEFKRESLRRRSLST